uniref:Neurotransmitter-gated ion-channel ligand-binding domain-containing protein n=1 Tax=Strigamia maritima TaxID=126957 RepID=T1JBH4_STRMM
MYLIHIFLLTTSLFAINSYAGEAGLLSNEGKLRKELFTNRKINTHTRPKQHHQATTNIIVHFFIFHILDLDEKTEIFSTNAYLMQTWDDLNFVWEPEDYGGLYYLPVDFEEIWKPDIYLLNNAESTNILPVAKTQIFLYNDGRVRWWPPGTFKSICPIDLKAFPFDQQTCHLYFESWSATGDEINLTLYNQEENFPVEILLVEEHNEWELVASNRTRNIHTPDPGDDKIFFTSLIFHITLKRRMPYYHLAIITPTIIAILITFVIFWISPASEHKLFTSAVNMTILFILIVHLFWVVPRSGSSVAGIIIFCGNGAFFAGLTFLLTITTISIYKNPPSFPPPIWFTNLLSGWLGSVVCLPDKTSIGSSELLDNDEDETKSNLKVVLSDWQLVACGLDKLGFILYCIIMSIVALAAFA